MNYKNFVAVCNASSKEMKVALGLRKNPKTYHTNPYAPCPNSLTIWYLFVMTAGKTGAVGAGVGADMRKYDF